MSEEPIQLDLARLGDYRLSVLVGELAAPDGLTRIRIDGTGRIEAAQVCADVLVGAEAVTAEIIRDGGRVTDRALGILSREETIDILTQASGIPWTQPVSSRAGVPPEAVTNWTFTTATGEALTLRMWLRDAEQDPVVGPVLRKVAGHVHRIAKGRIFI